MTRAHLFETTTFVVEDAVGLVVLRADAADDDDAPAMYICEYVCMLVCMSYIHRHKHTHTLHFTYRWLHLKKDDFLPLT